MKEKDFTKMTKTEKLKMPIDYGLLDEIPITRALFIPIRQKMDGYGLSAMFVKNRDDWMRVGDYDCFRFDGGGAYLKGDFEYGGVVFFLPNGTTYECGGQFNVANK